MSEENAQTHQLTVRIDSLSYGRAAVGRVDGKVVFVEGAAPGDLVRAEVTGDKGRYLEASVSEVLEPGASRVEPPCPLVGRCGGCPWQHVDYQAQLEAKRDAVVDALERIAGLENPPVDPAEPSPRQFEYRNRLKLRFSKGRLGFYSARTHDVVPIPDCMIAEPRVREAIPSVETFVATLETRAVRVEIAARGELGGVVVAINSEGRLRKADVHRCKDFLAQRKNPVKGLVMWGRGWDRAWGDTRRRYAATKDVAWETQGAAFGQINTEANRRLVQKVLGTADPRAKDTVLDLYAGAGNYALALARLVRRVVAIESDTDAVEAGRRSAEHLGLENLEFVGTRVEKYLTRDDRLAPDVIIANPPRSGLGNATDAISDLKAKRVVYVSCNPTTLARDVRVFLSKGYEVEKVSPIDLFPNTFHVESVCRLVLT
jgi:23S rRNA (uracil1939-C5)-methyltransferase